MSRINPKSYAIPTRTRTLVCSLTHSPTHSLALPLTLSVSNYISNCVEISHGSRCFEHVVGQRCSSLSEPRPESNACVCQQVKFEPKQEGAYTAKFQIVSSVVVKDYQPGSQNGNSFQCTVSIEVLAEKPNVEVSARFTRYLAPRVCSAKCTLCVTEGNLVCGTEMMDCSGNHAADIFKRGGFFMHRRHVWWNSS